MASVKVPARDIIIAVADSNVTTWLEVAGLNSATVNRAENEAKTETTTFDDNGNYSERPMQRGASLALAGFLYKDSVTGAGDPGQARVAALAKLVAEEGMGKVRFRHPMDTEWEVWNATFSNSGGGGGNNDMTGWGATIVRDGVETMMAVV